LISAKTVHLKASGYLFISIIVGLLLSCSPGTRRLEGLKESFTGKTIHNINQTSCVVKEDTIDQLTGLRLTELMPVQLFSFTHEPLKAFFDSKPFMVCNANLSRAGKRNFFLNLQFLIQASKLNISYHGIAEGSIVQFKLINGDQISLYSLDSDQGKILSKEYKMYAGIYPVSTKDLKKLRKYEVTEMGVHWNGGFEKYDIHIIDFFKTQILCLSKIK